MTYAIQLRDYQNECVETVLDEYKAGIASQLIVLPTGSGKTVVMAAIAKELNRRVLILAHREELITQTIEKFQLFWPEVSIGVCMADQDEIDCQIVVGSVQSCSRPKRLDRLKEQGFHALFIDESHHAVSDSYQAVIESLGFTAGNADKLLLGVTATPGRSDKKGLGNTFEKIVFSRSISTMIRAGYLAGVTGRKILTNFTFEKIRVNHGDFAIDELAEAVDTEERNAFVVDKFKEYAAGRKGVAFCVNVAHCHHLAEGFRSQGIAATSVWGDMTTERKKRALDDLKAGRIQVVTSCGILTEGFDEPSISVIVMARPTKSSSLYVQCIGRGLRLWPGKENCLVLDFTDRGHSLDSILSLSTAIPEVATVEEDKGEWEQEEHEEIDRTPKVECLDSVDKEFDILGARRFVWISIGDDQWSLLDDDKNEIVMTPEGSGYTATLYRSNGPQHRITSTPITLPYCSGICEDFARRNLKIDFCDLNEAAWMKREEKPTPGQRTYLESQNAWDETFTKAQASLEIRKVISLKNKQRRLDPVVDEPITMPQKYFLVGRGVDVSGMTKREAMRRISRIKQGVR